MKVPQMFKSKNKLATILTIGCLLPAFSVSAVYATPAQTNANTTLLNTIITKGNNEIQRRLNTLSTLDSKITSSTKLNASDQSTLTTEVNNEISGLTSLKTTLDACTTASCAKSSAQSIFSEYRVYLLVVPQVEMISTADHQQQVEAQLTQIANQLTTRLSTSSANSSTLQADLTSMTGNISAAQKLSAEVESSVGGLTPANYDSNHSLLAQYYGDLKTAHSDNQAAQSEGQTILKALEA